MNRPEPSVGADRSSPGTVLHTGRVPSPAYRLAVVSDSVSTGGAETITRSLIAALPAEIEVVVLGRDAAIVESVASARAGTRAEVVGPSALEWRRALSRSRVDVAHINLPAFNASIPAIAGAMLARTPYLVVDHLPTEGMSWKGRAWQRLVTSRACTRVAVGPSTAHAVARLAGVPDALIAIVHNAVPDPGVVERAPHDGPVRLGILGRLVAQKGVDVALEALVGVDGCVLRIAGDGPDRTALEARARALGVADRVTFLGHVDGHDFLVDQDMLLLPSRAEGLPLVLLEAMQLGTVVVASRVGSIPDVLVDDESGLLVDADDPQGLAEAVRRAVSDSDLRRRLGQEARAVAVREFSVDDMVRGYTAIYESALRR